MSSAPHWMDKLSPEEKRALLTKLLQKKTSNPKSAPLSFGQERLWFLNQFEPDNPIYNESGGFRLIGPLNLAAAEKIHNEIGRRHEVLRTTFGTVDGRPVQIIAPTPTLTLDVRDLSQLHEREQEAEVVRLAKEQANQPFDLARGPLMRIALLRLGEADHVLLMTLHHIICDGWSMGVLTREVLTLYEAFSHGRPSPLPALPIQYADFVIWQRQWLQGEALEAQLTYWKQQLGGGLPVLELPTDRPRPAIQSFRGAIHQFVLPPSLSESIKDLSRREGVTPFMMLLAAFQTLLHRYTGQEDIIVGSPIAGRNRAETEGLIGFFVNTLVLRTSLSGNPSFRELLGRVRDVTLGAYAHQDLPFEKLVEELQPERDLSHTPLFQVAFVLQNAPMPLLELPGLTLTPVMVHSGTAKFDLTLCLWEGAEGLTGCFEYNTDLFESTTIARMQEHFQILLEGIAADPDQHLMSLPCLDETERRQLLMKRHNLRRKGSLDRLDDIEEITNLTRNQLLIWVGQKLRPDVPLYNLVATLTISGEVDREHFQKAFQTLVNSSDALRTVIEERDGVPQQRVISSFPYTMEYLDFSQFSEPEAQRHAWVRERCQVPVDFQKCSFDSVLIKLSDKKFVWYLNQHHIITDGWSVWLIFHRMAELYESSLRGQLGEKVELPLFQDYIEHERASRGSSRYLRAQAYWREKLAEEPEPMTFYGPRPLKQTTRVQRVSWDIGFERTKKLKAIAAQESFLARTLDASLFNIFAMLLCTYLYRLTGNRRISFGTLFHNRHSQAFKETIGLFMEVLLLRVTIEEGDTFLSLLKKVKVEMVETLRHGQYAIRNPSQNKVYDVMLNYHNMSNASGTKYNGVPVQAEAVHARHEDDSLGLRILDFGASGSFTLEFDFNCDVFAEEHRGQAIQHFLQVMDAFLADSTQPLHRVNLLTAEEKQRILVEFNQTETAFPETQTVSQLFEDQVRKTPDQVAVIFEGQSLTYAQLNANANRLAHHLRSLGVGPDVLVALLANRSIDFLTAMLAIFKAGGAYLPLDPFYPPKRLCQMLSQSQSPLVLAATEFLATVSSALESLPVEELPRILPMEELLQRDQSEENLSACCGPRNLSYVIYTSGSTGAPKGAMVEQVGMLNHLYAKIIDLQLTGTDIVAQTASQCFDISVWQFLAALLVGGQVHIVNDEVAHDPWRLLKLVERERVTILETVPSLLQAMLGEIVIQGRPRPDWSALRWLIVTGEALPPELCRQCLSLFPDIPLLNAYGPTECSDDVTHYPIYQPPAPDVAHMPIGRPVANMQLYVLDHTLSPVPAGVPGELYVGGIGVGRGYLYDAARTAAVFIPDPFSRKPGARLYKTGDLVRYRSGGTLEFLGRIDHQVKIRGFRIELGEIEAALDQHPAVQQNVVLAREDVPGDKRLVAYVVTVPEQAVTISELRNYLMEKLPEYMVPSAFVLLEALPLTPNGKVDRKALPAPDRLRPELEERFEGPRNPTEKALAGIWSQVLGVEQVGIHDNFFELGGHSLLATQLMFRVHETFHVELPLRRLFESPTVAGLAHAIELARQPQDQSQVDQMSQEASLFQAMTVADLNAEAVLDPAICSETLPVQEVTEPTSIFLTGATGFLGAFLLHELLETTRADILCLVRSSNAEEGKRRIQRNLEFYSLWDESLSNRIVPLPGDLSQPYLGLSAEQFRILASQLDVIYHNGALVNFIYPYHAHKAPNVLGTQEVLRLASECKLKPVHYVSTISVFQVVGRTGDQVFREQDDLDQTGAPYSGYAQSKWVAEKLVTMAGSRGLPVTIYRPGLVSGHSQSGIWNADDFAVNLVRACIQLGSVPDVDVMVNLVPVDYVSKAIVHLSKQKASLGKVFHLVNPQPAHSRQLIDWLRSLGYPLQQMSYENWRTILLNLAEYFHQPDWAPFLHLIKEVEADRIIEPQFECQNTLAGLAGSSIVCPPVGPELLGTYLSYFIGRGFLNAPQPQGEPGRSTEVSFGWADAATAG